MNKLVTLTAAALAATASAAPAVAADLASPSRAVAVGNLSTPAGVEAFNRRVRYAAKLVCGDAPGRRSLAENLQISRCVADAVTSHAPELQASIGGTPAA